MRIQRVVAFVGAFLGTTALSVDAATVPANADANVCAFATATLYVRDAAQTAFPPGYLSCIGADQKTIARCASCNCRDKQSGSTGGVTVEWGLCIEGSDACVTSQTPDRKFCGNSSESGASFSPGKVTGADTDGTTVSTPVATTPGDVEQLASSSTSLTGSSSNGSSSYIVAGCAVAGVAAVAMFAVARKRQNEPKELGTPVLDSTAAAGYDNNSTSKAKSNKFTESQIVYKNRLSERMSGESILDDDSFRTSSHPMPMPVPSNAGYQQKQQQVPHHQQQPSHFGVPPSYAAPASSSQQTRPVGDSIMRESSFFGSFDDDDERFSVEEGSPSQRSGFESIAYDKEQSKPDFDSSFISIDDHTDFTSSQVDFSATARSDDTVYDNRSTSLSIESQGLTMYERDTEASELMRESADSVMFSASSSSLSFYEEEGSPRKSIEF